MNVGDSGPDRDIGREIRMALRILMQSGREMNSTLARRLDVNVTDLQAMDHLLTDEGELGPVQLAHLLGIRSASASVLVDRLESAGHLRRHRDHGDRRRVTLEVTESAQREVVEAMLPLFGRLTEVTDALDPEQAEVVLDFLVQTTRVIQEFARTPDQRSEAGSMAGPAATHARGTAPGTDEPSR